jgi:hypothetical protein
MAQYPASARKLGGKDEREVENMQPATPGPPIFQRPGHPHRIPNRNSSQCNRAQEGRVFPSCACIYAYPRYASPPPSTMAAYRPTPIAVLLRGRPGICFAAALMALGFGSPGFFFHSVSLCVCERGKGGGATNLALQRADLEPREDLARLVAVADVLEGLGRVLAGEVEEDLLAAAGSFHQFSFPRIGCRVGTHGCSSTKLLAL